MIVHLPDGLRDDELLYSALARSASMLEPPAARDFLLAAFGTDTIVAVIDLPSRLDVAAARILSLRGEPDPAATLMNQHTMFPFYAAVVDTAVAARAAALMRSNGGGRVHGILGVRASRVTGAHCRQARSAKSRLTGLGPQAAGQLSGEMGVKADMLAQRWGGPL